jgi:hypothetical protein
MSEIETNPVRPDVQHDVPMKLSVWPVNIGAGIAVRQHRRAHQRHRSAFARMILNGEYEQVCRGAPAGGKRRPQIIDINMDEAMPGQSGRHARC